MQTLAQSGNGIAGYVDTLQEARRFFLEEAAANLFPIANDVKIQVEFNPAVIAEYRLIGYETRLLDRADFNNDQVDAGEIGSGHSVTAIYEITPVGGETLIDPLRYGAPAPAAEASGEYAFLRIRYKRPGEDESVLIERAITRADAAADFDAAPQETRFAIAAAGYAQLLRGDPFLDGAFDYDAVIEIAQAARGADEYGYRAGFIQLARLAQSAAAQAALERPGQGE